MTTTSMISSNARRQGELWGARPADWAEVERQQAPTYEAALEHLDLGLGHTLLDAGCGAGAFLALAAERGAHPYGLDAASTLLDQARLRVPHADLRHGELERLPYADDTFDAVTSFNSIFFAADMTAALAELNRVAKPDGRIVIQVWGRPERCDLGAMLGALASLRADAPAPPPLYQPGVLEELARNAGLRPGTAFDVTTALGFADQATLVRHLLAAGGAVDAAEAIGPERTGALIAEALSPFRSADGSYVLHNEWHLLVCDPGRS